MQTILLELNVELLKDTSAIMVEKFYADVAVLCDLSTNVKTRSRHFSAKKLINHISTWAFSRTDNPDECIRVFGEALRDYSIAYKPAGLDLIENASRLNDKEFMDGNFRRVYKEFKPTRV